MSKLVVYMWDVTLHRKGSQAASSEDAAVIYARQFAQDRKKGRGRGNISSLCVWLRSTLSNFSWSLLIFSTSL